MTDKIKNHKNKDDILKTEIDDTNGDIDSFFEEFDKINIEFKETASFDSNKSHLESGDKTEIGGGIAGMAKELKRKLGKKGKKNKRRSRRNVRKKNKKNRKKIWIKRVLTACGLLALIGIVITAFILQDTEKINWDNIYEDLAESSTIYDDSGNEIESIYSGEGSRVIVDYEEMPENLINAFIAIEDKTFRKHHGFNFIRMVGAIKDTVFNSKRIGGTSTITQQLARNLWLTETKSSRGIKGIKRKIQEAYYAIQLERHLSKEQIIEAYLNTIALGQNSLGVQAASQNYFSKDVQDLKLLECAALASLPQAPSTYSYIQTVAKGEVSKNDSRIIKQGKYNTYLYNDTAEERVETVLALMEEQEYITAEKHAKIDISNLRKKIKPNLDSQSEEAQFFVDYTIKSVTQDIMTEYERTEQEATQMVYSGGLKIYTTLNKKMQKAVEDQFKENSNFPGVTGLNRDASGNIKGNGDSILLYKYDNFFDSKGNFKLKKGEFTIEDDGDIVLKKGKRLNFYKIGSDDNKDINIEFKDMYIQEDGIFYSINGGVINIPSEYKKLNSKGNLVISAEFMKEKPDFMDVSEDSIDISNASYSLRQQVQQPQASMVILDHSNGQIKAMVGGRNIEGKMNFNRSTSPRQPGSSIKPIGTYGPAIEMGAEKQQIQNGESSFGTYWTAASVINDEEMKFQGKVWPKNWYSGYQGPKTLRYCVEQSINTTAVKVLNNIGTERSTDFLRKLGVTTVVDEGNVNDMNPAALALGGMTEGISPLEMASAYGSYANGGTHVETTTYTEIRDKDDDLVLEKKQESTKAMDEGTAFIMTDILRTTVTNGLGSSASISNAPVAGKTGTTTDNYDAWFVGMTPKYAAAVWIGNDVNIELTEGSSKAAKLWSKVMNSAIEGQESGSFKSAPSNVSKQTVSGISEYFIDGTAPGSLDFTEETVNICVDSGYLGTPWCPVVKETTYNELAGGESAPEYYCNLHNLDVNQFPIDPKKKLDETFMNPEEEKEEEEQKPVEPVEQNPTDPTTSTQGINANSVLSKNTYSRLYSLSRYYQNTIIGSVPFYRRAS